MRKLIIFLPPSLDLVDSMYEASLAGEQAGRSGHLKCENHYECECHRAQWDKGWERGNAVFRTLQLTVTLR